jgi:hypothetical protein
MDLQYSFNLALLQIDWLIDRIFYSRFLYITYIKVLHTILSFEHFTYIGFYLHFYIFRWFNFTRTIRLKPLAGMSFTQKGGIYCPLPFVICPPQNPHRPPPSQSPILEKVPLFIMFPYQQPNPLSLIHFYPNALYPPFPLCYFHEQDLFKILYSWPCFSEKKNPDLLFALFPPISLQSPHILVWGRWGLV